MRRRSVLGGLALGAASGDVHASKAATRQRSGVTPVLNTLAIPVSAAQNRQYSYTDKVSGYFHGRTHMDANPDWFNGWNIATKRVIHDYRLSVDGVALSRADALAIVSPHKLVRTYDTATETLSMLDGLAVLVIQVSGVSGGQIGLALTGDLTDAGVISPQGIWFAPKEAAGTVVLLAPIANVVLQFDPTRGALGPATMGGFFLIHAATKARAIALLARVRRNLPALLISRAQRMEALVAGTHALDAGDTDRTKALLWMRLTGDQLVTKQLGTGIYAGLPWFNDYWGRDTFISITGLLFVNGQYEEAAQVFESFAALQDLDPASKTYGRVPNRARPDGIEYNSADGTPRFIITLADLVNRSGDVTLAKRLWPAVKRAVEGVLAHNVDELGLITHDDADTWMDAKEKGVRAWSPRGNRAVDVQALWLRAFEATARIADIAVARNGQRTGQSVEVMAFFTKLASASGKLRLGMERFVHPVTGELVDHLRPDGVQNTQLRPNALFALGWSGADHGLTRTQLERDMTQVRNSWEGLVYPWGMATLSQDDPGFYPYHEHWHYYHKDAAYHNGTVWPWLNGIAIEQMLRFNQIDLAWSLFENMNRQALHEGAVGSLAECADALPLDGASWTRRTGTFLQAWSNAEQLRVWQACFLGFRASGHGNLSIRSRLPLSVKDIQCSFRSSRGRLDGHFHIGGAQKWRFVWHGQDVNLDFNALQFGEVTSRVALKDKWSVIFATVDHALTADCYDQADNLVSQLTPVRDLTGLAERLVDDPLRPASDLERFHMAQRIFGDLDFCSPRLQANLKSLSVRHDPPLTY